MSSTVSLFSEMMPTPLAIALAVMGWSRCSVSVPVSRPNVVARSQGRNFSLNFHLEANISVLVSIEAKILALFSVLVSGFLSRSQSRSQELCPGGRFRLAERDRLVVGGWSRVVMGWSPVTMITLMPAERHLATASGTAARGGSIIDMSPTKRSPVSGKFWSSASNG